MPIKQLNVKTTRYNQERVQELERGLSHYSTKGEGDALFYWSGVGRMLHTAKGNLRSPYGTATSDLDGHEYDLFEKGVINCQRFLEEGIDLQQLEMIRLSAAQAP